MNMSVHLLLSYILLLCFMSVNLSLLFLLQILRKPSSCKILWADCLKKPKDYGERQSDRKNIWLESLIERMRKRRRKRMGERERDRQRERERERERDERKR